MEKLSPGAARITQVAIDVACPVCGHAITYEAPPGDDTWQCDECDAWVYVAMTIRIATSARKS